MLKPLDLYVLIALLALPPAEGWTQSAFADKIGIAEPSLTRSLQRLGGSGLWDRRRHRVAAHDAQELIIHAIRFLSPPRLGPPTRGIATAHSAPPMREQLFAGTEMVWPQEDGATFGVALDPIHPAAPTCAIESPALHTLLALVDTLRVGGARERAIAEKLFRARVGA